MRQREWFAVGLCIFVSCSAVAQAQEPELEVVAPDSVSVTGSDNESKQFSIWLRNSGASSVIPKFAVAAEDADGEAVTNVTVKPATGEALPAWDVRRYRLRLVGKASDDGASGQLIARADRLAPVSVDLTLGPEPPTGIDPSHLLLALGALALVLVGRRAIVAGIGDKSLKATLPEKDWDFSTGFASTLVAGGGLLTTVVAAGVLPEDTEAFSKSEYTALGIIFTVAIVVAGIFYAAFVIEKDGKKLGSVWAFLLAAFLTVWATFGQLVVLGLLVSELTDDEGFSGTADEVLPVFVVVSLIVLWVYTRRIEWIIAPDKPERKRTKTRKRKEKVRAAVASLEAVAAEDAETVAVNAIALAEAIPERRGRFPLL